MRRTLAALVIGLGIIAGTVTSGTAAADTRADDVHTLIWAHAGWFKKFDDCAWVGEQGRAVGRWRAWECDYYSTEPEPWELYVDYI